MRKKIFQFASIGSFLAATAFCVVKSHQVNQQAMFANVLLENVEVLSSGESSSNSTPNSDWWQFLGYANPCTGGGMRLYCSSAQGNSSAHCTYHCGTSIK